MTILIVGIIAVAVWLTLRWRRSVNRELQRLLKTISEDTLVDFTLLPAASGKATEAYIQGFRSRNQPKETECQYLQYLGQVLFAK